MTKAGTVGAAVVRAAELFPLAEAVVDGDQRWTFDDLHGQVRSYAASLLAMGLQRGDRVALWAPNGHRFVAAALATSYIGLVLVPINTRYKSAEAASIIRQSGAKVLLVANGFLGNDYLASLRGDEPISRFTPVAQLPQLQRVVVVDDSEVAESTSWTDFLLAGRTITEQALRDQSSQVEPSDLSDLFYTSGTTGHPKGVMTTHEQNLRVYQAWVDADLVRRGDRCLIISPMFHTFGYKAGVLACLLAGATIIPQPLFEPALSLSLISIERITLVPGPPTLYSAMLDHPARSGLDLSSLRLAVTGAAFVPETLVKRMLSELFQCVVIAYGMTETCGTVTFGEPICHGAEEAAKSSGLPLEGTEVAIAGDGTGYGAPGIAGEILVRGYNVMKGYFQDPATTALAIDSEGWLHTGDVGFLDSGGGLHVTDRIKDMFIVGGFNVYPAEVESVICSHPDVAEAAVVGVPNERLGEVGRAFVVVHANAVITEEQILEYCRTNMANFKVPRAVYLVSSLPRTSSGKVQRFALRTSKWRS